MFETIKLEEADRDRTVIKRALSKAGISANVIAAIETRALRTGRKITGPHATNRDPRWTRDLNHPQYGTERDCKIRAVKLFVQIFCFDNAPLLANALSEELGIRYLGSAIVPSSYRDTLLLERFDFNDLVREGLNPIHGHSSFHMGHEDPKQVPRHTPENINWRTMRSNLIQGDMTLREARIYFVKLIARYFELGELEVR